MAHNFKVGDEVYVVESDYASSYINKVINVTEDPEMPIVVDLKGYRHRVVRAFRPSEIRHIADVTWKDLSDGFVEAVYE